jgi:hypothetical protein
MLMTISPRRMCCTVFGAVAILSFVAAQVPKHQPAPNHHNSEPAQLLGIAFRPIKGEAGKTVKLYIRLTHPAPVGGFAVNLRSIRSKDVPLPVSITVPHGSLGVGLSIALRPKISGAVIVQATESGSNPQTTILNRQSKSNHTATLQVIAQSKGGSK